MVSEKETPQYSIFNEYLQLLKDLDVPKQCLVTNYRMSDIQRRKFTKLYRDGLLLKGKDNTNQRKALSIRVKRDKIKQFPSLLTPQTQIAKICAGECVNHAGMYYLIEKIVIHMMANDFDDQTIEIGDLWYNLTFLKQKLNLEEKLDSVEWNHIIGYALASRMYENYLKDPNGVCNDIKEIYPRKGSLGQLFTNYGVSIYDDKIISDLKKQEKVLTMKR